LESFGGLNWQKLAWLGIFFLDFIQVYVCMDERPNEIKKGVGKNWQYGRALQKENRRKKWRSNLLIALVGFNRT